MEQKDLTYLTTTNIVITLFVTGHLTMQNRERACKIYMGCSKKGVVDNAIQTLDHKGREKMSDTTAITIRLGADIDMATL